MNKSNENGRATVSNIWCCGKSIHSDGSYLIPFWFLCLLATVSLSCEKKFFFRSVGVMKEAAACNFLLMGLRLLLSVGFFVFILTFAQ